MRRVLVTGYGGFLGRAICVQLLAAGYRVRGLARHAYPALADLGVETRLGDATRVEDCRAAVEGVEAVIHTAALAGVWGRREQYEAVNIGATENLLQCSREEGVAAFVHCSSPSVTFDGRPQSHIDESVPYPTRWLCDYPRTKAIAEQKVLAANTPTRMLTCALRPHLIWGPGDPHLIPRLIDKCRRHRLRCVGDGRNLIDTVHVDAAAHAHCLAVEALLAGRTSAAGRAYFITDGAPIPCWDWISQLLERAGLTPPQRRISLNQAYRIGAILEGLYGLLGWQQEPPMTRFVALQLGVDHYFSIEAARRELGYQPLANRQEKLAEMEGWLRQLAD